MLFAEEIIAHDQKSAGDGGCGALIPKRPPEPAAPRPRRAAAPQAGLLQLDIGRIVPSPYQPRKDFDADQLDELAHSIWPRA